MPFVRALFLPTALLPLSSLRFWCGVALLDGANASFSSMSAYAPFLVRSALSSFIRECFETIAHPQILSLGGFTVLSTKGLSSLLSRGNPFDLIRYPITYGLVAILAGTAVAQITFLNRALQRFDSREVIVSCSTESLASSCTLKSCA